MKKKITKLSTAIVFVLGLIILIYSYKSNNKAVIMNEKIRINNKSISIMLETGLETGIYEVSDDDEWPENGYVYNSLRSGCENGSTISFDDATGQVIIRGNISDKCYVYFDVEPIRITMISPSCPNAVVNWDRGLQQLAVNSFTTNSLECTMEEEIVSNVNNLNNYIMKQCNTTGTMTTCDAATASNQGNGELVYENGIRYEGKNPNNYVMFNNELWRIIGVFDSSSHGRIGENLVKLIRAESIGSYVWNGVSGRENDWANSTLYRMLNGCYLYQNNGNETINLTGQSGLCTTYAIGYYDSTNGSSPGYSNFRKTGINSNYRNMIADVTWYLGGVGKPGFSSYYPDNLYSYERNPNEVYNGRSASINGKVGLMYLSDYGYGVLGSSCTRGSYTVSFYYQNTRCGSQNWLYGKGDEWTIMPHSYEYYNVFLLSGSGCSSTNNSNSSYLVRPVIYLTEDVYRISGTGTAIDPYIIGLASS